jgi:hypothetical protein
MPEPLGATAGELSKIARPAREIRSNSILLAAGLAWCTALIHVQASIDHFSEYWLYSLFFIVLALAQAVWGFAIYRNPRRGLLILGAVGSLAVIALWIVSRTTGLPLGPTPGVAEEVGALDAIATADELLVVILMVLELRRLAPARVLMTRSLQAVAILLIVLSTLVLGGGFHAH